MDKQLIRWGYWAGLFCTVAGIVWRALIVLGVLPWVVKGLSPDTLIKGALLLFTLGIASAASAWAAGQKT